MRNMSIPSHIVFLYCSEKPAVARILLHISLLGNETGRRCTTSNGSLIKQWFTLKYNHYTAFGHWQVYSPSLWTGLLTKDCPKRLRESPDSTCRNHRSKLRASGMGSALQAPLTLVTNILCHLLDLYEHGVSIFYFERNRK